MNKFEQGASRSLHQLFGLIECELRSLWMSLWLLDNSGIDVCHFKYPRHFLCTDEFIFPSFPRHPLFIHLLVDVFSICILQHINVLRLHDSPLHVFIRVLIEPLMCLLCKSLGFLLSLQRSFDFLINLVKINVLLFSLIKV